MNYNDNIGLILDMIWYNVFFFSKERLVELQSPFDSSEESICEFFNEFNSLVEIKPPDDLLPFFDLRNNTYSSALYGFFHSKNSLRDMTFESFTEVLKDKMFHEYIINYYVECLGIKKITVVEGLLNGYEGAVDRVINKIKSPRGMSSTYKNMFCFFDESRDDLIEYFKYLQPILIQWRNKKKRKFNNELKYIKTEKNIDDTNKLINFAVPIKLKYFTYSISFIIKHHLTAEWDDTHKTVIYNVYTFIYFDTYFNYGHVTVLEAFKLIANKTKVEIIELLRKRDFVSRKEIRENCYKISERSIDRYLKEMVVDRALIKEKNNYCINSDYFRYSKKLINDFLEPLSKLTLEDMEGGYD